MDRRAVIVRATAGLAAPRIARARGAWPERIVARVLPGGSVDAIPAEIGKCGRVTRGIYITADH